MKKTKDPKLFGALIREGVPVDRFCIDALGTALPTVLKNMGVDMTDISIRIESSDQNSNDQMVHGSDSPDALVMKVNRAVEGKSVGHYFSSDNEGSPNGGGKGFDCAFECVAHQMKERYGVDLDPAQLREAAAKEVETNKDVSEAIRNGWHKFTLDKGFYGGGELYRSKPDSCGRAGTYREIRKYSKKYEVAADHQPSVSEWAWAKDEWVRNIPKSELGTISIDYEMHYLTGNFGWKANLQREYNLKQENLMRAGKYDEAIYHAVYNNTIKLACQNGPAEFIEKLRQNLTTGKFLNTYVKLKIITPQQKENLQTRFESDFITMTRRPDNDNDTTKRQKLVSVNIPKNKS